MLLWEMVPSNHRNPKKRSNLFNGNLYTTSQEGVEIGLSRLFEFVRARSTARINVTVESIAATWICIDHYYDGLERIPGKYYMPVASTRAVTIYPPDDRPEGHPLDRLNDLFTLQLAFSQPQRNPYYSDDREVLARRLLHSAHRAWIDTWNLMTKVEGHPRDKWPVKLWIHRHPERVWEITNDERLVEFPDHPPVDESIVDAVYR